MEGIASQVSVPTTMDANRTDMVSTSIEYPALCSAPEYFSTCIQSTMEGRSEFSTHFGSGD